MWWAAVVGANSAKCNLPVGSSTLNGWSNNGAAKATVKRRGKCFCLRPSPCRSRGQAWKRGGGSCKQIWLASCQALLSAKHAYGLGRNVPFWRQYRRNVSIFFKDAEGTVPRLQISSINSIFEEQQHQEVISHCHSAVVRPHEFYYIQSMCW